jgi:chaperonin GroEL (HSP60 family)
MNGTQGIQPIFILPEGTSRTKGKEAQKNNITAAKLVADAVRTTLGPKGMDKMLVDSLGDVTITNDGATILNEMQIEHPAAKMMVEVAKTQDEAVGDEAVGDGTTTAVIIAGELLSEASKLLEQQIHPTVITKGFRLAKFKSLDILEKLATKVSIEDEKTLKMIANTAMTGKSAERASERLTELAVKAVRRIAEVLIDGIVLDKEVVHSGMPKRIERAKIVLVDSALEVKELEGDAKINIDSPEKLQAFLDEEEKGLKEMVDRILKSGASVVFCQKGIDDMAQHYLAKMNVLAARRVKKSDMDKLSRATGAKVVTNLKDLDRSDLGYAGLVEEKKIAGDEMIFVEKCRSPKAVTILIRGGSEHVVDEVERAMEDAIKGVAAALELGKVVPGGGAIEIQMAKQLRKYAESFKGREQLAVNAFANAMEIVPKSLAENGGLDPIDKLAQLRSEHDKKRFSAGLDIFTGNVSNMLALGVIEPLKIKLQAIKSASEVAEMILRVDDMISSGAGEKMPPMPPGGGMPPGGEY